MTKPKGQQRSGSRVSGLAHRHHRIQAATRCPDDGPGSNQDIEIAGDVIGTVEPLGARAMHADRQEDSIFTIREEHREGVDPR